MCSPSNQQGAVSRSAFYGAHDTHHLVVISYGIQRGVMLSRLQPVSLRTVLNREQAVFVGEGYVPCMVTLHAVLVCGPIARWRVALLHYSPAPQWHGRRTAVLYCSFELLCSSPADLRHARMVYLLYVSSVPETCTCGSSEQHAYASAGKQPCHGPMQCPGRLGGSAFEVAVGYSHQVVHYSHDAGVACCTWATMCSGLARPSLLALLRRHWGIDQAG